MSPQTQSSRSRLQIGKEVTRGLAVTPTRVHRHNSITWSDEIRLEDYADQISQSLAMTSVPPTQQRRGTMAAIDEYLSFDQVLLPLLSGVRGGVTPVAGFIDVLATTSTAATTVAGTTVVLTSVANIAAGDDINLGGVVREVASVNTGTRTVTVTTAWGSILASGVSARVTRDSSTAQLWTFNPGLQTDPDIDTFTGEYTEAAGSVRDTVDAPYLFTTEFEITLAMDSVPMLKTSLVGRASDGATFTASITLPTLAYGKELGWGLFDDADWGSIGSTPVQGQVLDLSIKWSGFLIARYFADLRDDEDFSNHGYMGGRMLEVSGTIAVDPSTGGFTTRHKDYKAAGTPRAYRVKINGTKMADGARRFMWVDLAGVHMTDSLQDYGASSDGMNQRSLTLRSIEHTSSGITRDVGFAVQNDLATYP